MMGKIMSVDDEEHICTSVKEVLENEGHKVITASNGKEALAKLKNEKVDLVLMDFFMPEMDGRELAERIREDNELRNLKLAFLTVARFGKLGIKKMKELKITGYMQKPFKEQDLINEVRRILGE